MGLRTNHSPAAGSEDRRSCGAESRACRSGVERDDADDVCARSALADLVRDVRLIRPWNALGMVPSALMAHAQAATSRVEEIARKGLL